MLTLLMCCAESINAPKACKTSLLRTALLSMVSTSQVALANWVLAAFSEVLLSSLLHGQFAFKDT